VYFFLLANCDDDVDDDDDDNDDDAYNDFPWNLSATPRATPPPPKRMNLRKTLSACGAFFEVFVPGLRTALRTTSGI